jgi:ribosomal protein L39E
LNDLTKDEKKGLRAAAAKAKQEKINNNPEYRDKQYKYNKEMQRDGTDARHYALDHFRHLELPLNSAKHRSVNSVRKVVNERTKRDIPEKPFRKKVELWKRAKQNGDDYVSDGQNDDVSDGQMDSTMDSTMDSQEARTASIPDAAARGPRPGQRDSSTASIPDAAARGPRPGQPESSTASIPDASSPPTYTRTDHKRHRKNGTFNSLPEKEQKALRAAVAKAKQVYKKNNPKYQQRQNEQNHQLQQDGKDARHYALDHFRHLKPPLDLVPNKHRSVDSVRKVVNERTERDIPRKPFKKKIALWKRAKQNGDDYVSDGQDDDVSDGQDE